MRRITVGLLVGLLVSVLAVSQSGVPAEGASGQDHCELSLETGVRTCFASYDEMLVDLGLSPARMSAAVAAGEDMSATLLEEGVIGIHFDRPFFDDSLGSLAITGTD